MKETYKTFVAAMTGKPMLSGALAVLAALLLFHAGVAVGSHRRTHDGGMHEWRFRTHGFEMRLPHGFIGNGHGAVGTISVVASSSVTIQTHDGETKMIFLTGKTMIRDSFANASSSALLVGERIMALGMPNENGDLMADVIRIVPNDLVKNK